jgi:catechol 2,3-dioxygenase-like lactoylglutathione lyase family enzyme
MDLTIQTALLNTTNLEQSIEFYCDVLDLRLQSQGDRLAALMINDNHRRQVLLLRELGRNAHHAGRGSIGPRMLSFEAASLDELEVIEQRFEQRHALVWQGRTETYKAIMGLDPDRIEISVAASLTGAPIRSEDWTNLDDIIYAIE